MEVKRSKSMSSRECSTFLSGPASRFSLPPRQSESRTDLVQHEVVADVSINAASPVHNYGLPVADTESSTSVGQVEENHHEEETDSSDAASSAGAERQGREKKKRITSTTVSRVTALVILAIVIASVFSVPIIVFIYETRGSPETGCVAEVYTGKVCQSQLAARQSCIAGREANSEVLVSLTPSEQLLAEQQLGRLLARVSPSPRCRRELTEFLCVEVMGGFCNGAGVVHRPSRRECERLSTTVCATEFQIVQSLFEASGSELTCDSFPDASSICSVPIRPGKGSENRNNPMHSNGSGMTATMGLAPPDRNCSQGFFADETTDLLLCKPECGEWWPQPERQLKVLTVLVLMAGAVGISLSLVVLLLSFVNYRTIFKFPGIFIFYQMLSSLVYAVVFVMSYVDFKSLFCRSMDLIENLMPGNETPMCTISGATWIYISHQVALWWIFHLSMVFCAVFWPFEYQYWKKQGYFKYIHFVMVALALTLPIIPAMITFKIDGYVLYFLIRPDCVARNTQASFYAHVVPLIIAVATGLYLLVLIFWKLYSEAKQGTTIREVEIKLLLLLCFYVLVWTDVIAITVATMIEADDYRNTLTEYFTCEAAGVEGCPRDSFEGFDVVSKTVAYSLVSLYPGIFLIYFVNKKCRYICTQSTATANSTGSNASVRTHNYPHTHTRTDLYTHS